MVKEGDKSPTWKAVDQDGTEKSSADYSGRWHVLYFYPKDDTPGCTIEACGFRDRYDSLGRRIAVIGVSADSAKSHKAFADTYNLPFTLIADTDKAIIRAFGADGIIFPKRVTFLIDPEGVIRKTYHGFDATYHAQTIEDDLNFFGVS